MRFQPEWRQIDRLLSRTRENENGCWITTTWAGGAGYGVTRFRGLRMMAHRATYLYFRSEIFDDLELDHLCRTPACINPWHTEPVTRRENALRTAPATKTHCTQGHSLSGDNLRVRANGWRICVECSRKSGRDYWARRSAS